MQLCDSHVSESFDVNEGDCCVNEGDRGGI